MSIQPNPKLDQPFFGMEIQSVTSSQPLTNVQQYKIVTTGATYVLQGQEMEMWRNIDPASNTESLRLVARLRFSTTLGKFQRNYAYKRIAQLENEQLKITFYSDSLFLIESKIEGLTYVHDNLIDDAPWDKSKEGYHRMWTDRNGGSLLAKGSGDIQAEALSTPNVVNPGSILGTKLDLTIGAKMGHMVFPARYFNFQELYGESARPFHLFTYGGMATANYVANNISETLIADNYFGYVVGITVFQIQDPRKGWLMAHPELYDEAYKHLMTRWAIHYDNPANPEDLLSVVHPIQEAEYEKITCYHHPKPASLSLGKFKGFPGSHYKYMTCEEKDNLKQNIQDAHAKGLKYIVGIGLYAIWLPESHEYLLFEWLRNLIEEYGIDGFYLDNGSYGDVGEGPWLATYRFIKKFREEFGEEMYLYHHNSNDVWGGRAGDNPGLRAMMVDTYMNAILSGEVGEAAVMHDPHNEYLRYVACGYGFTQTFATVKRQSSMHGAISEWEKTRVLVENLNGMERIALSYLNAAMGQQVWQPFLAAYEARKAGLSQANLDVNWPPEWFVPLTPPNINWTIDRQDETATVRVSFQSKQPASREICVRKVHKPEDVIVWWSGSGNLTLDCDDIVAVDSSPSDTEHVLSFEGDADAHYVIRVRSEVGNGEKVLGYVGVIAT